MEVLLINSLLLSFIWRRWNLLKLGGTEKVKTNSASLPCASVTTLLPLSDLWLSLQRWQWFRVPSPMYSWFGPPGWSLPASWHRSVCLPSVWIRQPALATSVVISQDVHQFQVCFLASLQQCCFQTTSEEKTCDNYVDTNHQKSYSFFSYKRPVISENQIWQIFRNM